MSEIQRSQRLVQLLLLVALGGLLYLFNDLIKPGLTAILLVMVSNPWRVKLSNYLRNFPLLLRFNNLLIASLFTMILAGAVILPLIALLVCFFKALRAINFALLYSQVIAFINSFSWLRPQFKGELLQALHAWHLNLLESSNLKTLYYVSSFSFHGISHLSYEFLLVIVLFFLFEYYLEPLLSLMQNLSPLNHELHAELQLGMVANIQVVFGSLFLLALAQGVAFGLLMACLGYHPLMLGLAAALCALVPLLGTALVWVPVVMNELAHGQIILALVVGCYGWLVMAVLIDNFLRLFLFKRLAQQFKFEHTVNEFVLLFAIAYGVAKLGLWGIILGPAAIALFMALVRAYLLAKSEKFNSVSG
jgi:predicted PurR-regulated permease PerM